MLRRFPFLLAVLILAAGCVPAAAPVQPMPGASPLQAPQPLQLTVVHSNDTWGYLEPCG